MISNRLHYTMGRRTPQYSPEDELSRIGLV